MKKILKFIKKNEKIVVFLIPAVISLLGGFFICGIGILQILGLINPLEDYIISGITIASLGYGLLAIGLFFLSKAESQV